MIDGTWLMVDGKLVTSLVEEWLTPAPITKLLHVKSGGNGKTQKENKKMKNVELKMVDGIRLRRIRFSLWDSVYSLRTLCYLFFLFLIHTNSYAQSVDSLITEALKNNPQLKALQFKIDAAGYRAESVNNLPVPNLSAEFSQVPVGELNLLNKSVSNNIALSQMFPLGGKINAMTDVERKNVIVEKDSYGIYKVSLIAQVRMSYFTIWSIERKIDVQKKNISLLNDLINSLDVSYSINRVNQADVLTIKSEIASNQTQLLILQNQKEAEIYKLNKLLGRQLDSKNVFTLRETPADSLKLSQNELMERLLRLNPTLNRMSSMIEMNKAMVEANNRELIPDLMLQGMIMRMPQGMTLTTASDLTMLRPKTEYMYSLMVSITLPFAPWSINKIKAKEQELYAGISSIEYEKNDMQRDMIAKLKEAFLKYNTAQNLVRLYTNEVLPLYSQATSAQVSAYQNNKANINTVIDSYRMLLMQQMNFYMAIADVQMALAEIEMMIGRKMDEL